MPSAPGQPQNDTTDPLYTNADLNATNVVELRQPPRPAPYYLPRGNASYYGYRSGVVVVTVGPGAVAPARSSTTH